MEGHVSDEVLAALADDELTRREQQRIRRHTARCDICRARVTILLRDSPEELETYRPLLLDLVRHWFSFRRFIAGVVALTMLGSVSAPVIYMVLRVRQEATPESVNRPARRNRSASTSQRSAPTRRVGGKTFRLVRGVWVDREYRPDVHGAVIPCHQFEEECQRLIERTLRLAAWTELGGPVVVVVESKAYGVIP